MKVSILIPIYNEEKTIEQLLDRIMAISIEGINFEIIVINDKSTDNSLSLLQKFGSNIKIINQKINSGKGAALKSGAQLATGDLIIVQDADLEYFPEDYYKLISPFIHFPNLDVVIGTRIRNRLPTKFYFSPYFYGGWLINFLFNLLSPIKINDIHSGYKLARREFWINLKLQENGFNFCHEFITKAVLKKAQIAQVKINYSPRTLTEGKKIKPKDGLIALQTILKYFIKERHLLQSET